MTAPTPPLPDDVVTAGETEEKLLTAFVARRTEERGQSRDGEHYANERAAELRLRDEENAHERRDENRRAWIRHFKRLANRHAELASDLAKKARALETEEM